MGNLSNTLKHMRDLQEEISLLDDKQGVPIKNILKDVIATGEISDIRYIGNNIFAVLFNKLKNTFRDNDYRLQKALYAYFIYDSGPKNSCNQYKVPKSEFDEVIKFLHNFHYLEVVESYSQIPMRDNPWKWVIEVDNHYLIIDVYLSDRAIEDIIMGAMEGYIVSKGKGGKYTEIFGLCFGNTRSSEINNKLKGMGERKHLHIERCVVHFRGNFTASSFLVNPKSFHVQSDIRDTFFPHEKILGYFHTHPYKSKSYATHPDIGITESGADKKFSIWFQEYLRKNMDEQIWLHLIIAIGKTKNIKKKITSKRVNDNIIEFSAGRYVFRVGVYRVNVDGTTNIKGIKLFCPKLLGWGC